MIEVLDQEFSQINQYINDKKASKIVFLVDENTHEYCLPILLNHLEIDIPFELVEVEAGEDNKNIHTAIQLWESFSDFELDRKAIVINLGGGVITDLGGFVASTYKRGISFINIPTTLLAMCDASIGGKTGIDHLYAKNIIGTFCTAEKVFIFPEFLKTLPYIQLKSGFAEMLKHGLIADAKHYQELISIEELTAQNIQHLIEKSVNIKQNIVLQDYQEQNIRKNLNFGHTVGHAVESYLLSQQQEITHGECVAIGMIVELHIAQQLGLISDQLLETIVPQLVFFYPPMPFSETEQLNFLQWIKKDKKAEKNEHLFSLITAIGCGVYNKSVKDTEILNALQFYQNLAKAL